MNTILRTLAAAAMLAASQASAATGDWPQYGFTAAGRRENTQETILTRETVPHLRLKWSAQIEVNRWSAPAVANGIVYVMGFRKPYLYALDARTGALVWQAKIGLFGIWSVSSPAVSDGVVYVGSKRGIHAFDAETGAVRWTLRSGSFGVSTPITVADGLVYAGIADGHLLAVDARTGKVKWTAYGGSSTISASAPSVADGVVCVTPAHGSSVSAFDARTGASLWSNDLFSPSFASAPATYKGTVFVSDGTYLMAFDAKTGQRRWASVDAYADGSGIAMSGGHIYVKNLIGYLQTYDAATGQMTWTDTGRMMDPTGTPATANGVLYINSIYDRGTLSAYDTHTGTRLWQAQSTGRFTGSFGTPTVANGMLYVSGGRGFEAYGLP